MDHDQLFKQLLFPQIEAFMTLFFPDLARRIDFSDAEPQDKESFTDIPAGFRRQSDLVLKLRERDGGRALFILLIEVEDRQGRTRPVYASHVKEAARDVGAEEDAEPTEWKADIGERLLTYHGALWSRYHLPMVPVVLYLFKAADGLVEARYRHEVLGKTFMELTYLTVGLPRLNAEAYLGRGRSLAGALAALMNPGRWPAWRLKAECLNVIARSGEDDARKFLALNCVETYLRLDDVGQRRFESLVREEGYMEAHKIRKTWADEMKEEGREEGREEGKQETLLKLLKLKFGSQADGLASRVRSIRDVERLDALAERVLFAETVEELGLGG